MAYCLKNCGEAKGRTAINILNKFRKLKKKPYWGKRPCPLREQGNVTPYSGDQSRALRTRILYFQIDRSTRNITVVRLSCGLFVLLIIFDVAILVAECA